MTLYEQKWQKFLKRIWPFKFIPFVDFVLAAGSLATGNVREESDFDVIVGVRQGRIFTARFFCWLVFGTLGWRAIHNIRTSDDQNIEAFNYESSSVQTYKDKLCFNHFVTPNAYRLSPPHNKYWKNLYKNLVPVYGDPQVIQKFFDANADWANLRTSDVQKLGSQYSGHWKSVWLARILEWILSGWFGDQLEKLKFIQIYFIKRGLKNNSYKPRIVFNDNELEFHPDTKRTENLFDF